jgi:hypothetical protein
MHNAAQGNIAPASDDNQNDACGTVVSEFVNLIEHVQSSLRLIERAIACETSLGSPESSANVVVLDDVSPRYTRATAALQACDANLSIALCSLLEPATPEP